MSEPVYIKRLAVQIETTEGDFLHIYCEDAGLILTLENIVEPKFCMWGDPRGTYASQRTNLTVENMRNYRITMGRPFGREEEIEGEKAIEQ
jgi:hypothetical protein